MVEEISCGRYGRTRGMMCLTGSARKRPEAPRACSKGGLRERYRPVQHVHVTRRAREIRHFRPLVNRCVEQYRQHAGVRILEFPAMALDVLR